MPKKKKQFPVLVTLLWCGVIAVPAFARAQEEAGFDVADSNFDGKISQRELKRYVAKRAPGFKQLDKLMHDLDTDSNGSLSLPEFVNCQKVLADLAPSRMPKSSGGLGDLADEGNGETARPIVEFAEHYEKIFAAEDPQLGETIPNVAAFDGDGNAFQLGQLKGKYAVLVFGCLT